MLTGTEVKSLRERKASLGEAYAHVRNGEIWLEGLTISAYGPGSYNNPRPPGPASSSCTNARSAKCWAALRSAG